MSTHEHHQDLLAMIRCDGFSREIVAVLLIKLLLIFMLWWLFFDVPDNHKPTAADVSRQIVGSAAAHHSHKQAVSPDD